MQTATTQFAIDESIAYGVRLNGAEQMTDLRQQIAADLTAGLADAEEQIAALESAGPADVAMVVAIMEKALDADADPRLVAGVAALRRITATG